MPLSIVNVNKITQWLGDCDANHPGCSAASTEYSPTRLLAVKDDELRVVTGITEHRRYVTLSYCWGRLSKEQESFLTTKSNIAARISGFHINELPRTLKDAILTVRALGIDFIWIDAICIIQDDKDDWSREASRMGKVYHHSYFTVATTNSESSFDGFLQDRERSCRASLGFALKGVQPLHSQTEVNETGIIHFRYPPEISVDDLLHDCEWDRRGWTLQEKLLSTRALYFTKDVIYYECVASQKIDNPGYKLPPKLPTPLELPTLLAELKNLTSTERIERREECYSTWYELSGCIQAGS